MSLVIEHESPCGATFCVAAAEPRSIGLDGVDPAQLRTSGWTRWWPSAEAASHQDPMPDMWSDLPVDPYMPDGLSHRRRRFGCIRAVRSGPTWHLTRLADRPFVQSADHVPLFGGMVRCFEPLEPTLLETTAFRWLLAADLALVGSVSDRRSWVLGVHQIRVLPSAGAAVSVTPEGRHRDGHEWVAMHLIDRVARDGGDSILYGPWGERVERLERRYETMVIDDVLLEHEVTPLQGDVPGGHRDILIVDFDVDPDESDEAP